MERLKILVADDETVVRLIKRIVVLGGYEAICGTTEKEIIEALEEEGEKVCLFIADASFGGGIDSGVVLAKRLQLRKPALRILIVSEHSVHVFRKHKLIKGFNFLQEPFTAAELWELIAKLCPKR